MASTNRTIEGHHITGMTVSGWRVVWGVLLIIAGVLAVLMPGVAALATAFAVVMLPLAGIASLALLVGAFPFASGIARAGLAFRMKPPRGWGWVLFDGVVSIVLGILVAIGWPASSIAIIGLLTGFTLISTGVWRIILRHGVLT